VHRISAARNLFASGQSGLFRPQTASGSDASHASLSVWCASEGWVDFDPTNNVIPILEHVTIGWGHDYGDVSPINGFIVGGGAHRVAVAVDVTPVRSPA
jgi:transglutaminase-like putative cysteine protease